jgi:hypothetical protein
MSVNVPPTRACEPGRRQRAHQTAMVERWAYCAQLDLLHRLYHEGAVDREAVAAWSRTLAEELALQLEALWVDGLGDGGKGGH